MLDTLGLTHEEIEARKKYIGASEIKKIIDGDWLELYEEKMGITTTDLSDVFQVQLGLYTESFNLQWTMKMKPELFTNNDLSFNQMITDDKGFKPTFYHQSLDFLAATPDAICTVNGVPGIMDFKHTHPNAWGKKDYASAEDRVIDTYKWQMQQQMLCTGREVAVIVPIYGNTYGPEIILHKNEEMQQIIMKKAKQFWEHIILEIEPRNQDPVAGPSISHDNMRSIDEDEFKSWNAYDEWCDLAKTFPQLSAAEKDLKVTKEKLKAIIPDDVKLIQGGGLVAKRNKKGAVTISVSEK